ncbi:MAG: hypothetical protein ACK2T3_02515, partial [Candidatus Promineifilaceae bacterium]
PDICYGDAKGGSLAKARYYLCTFQAVPYTNQPRILQTGWLKPITAFLPNVCIPGNFSRFLNGEQRCLMAMFQDMHQILETI